MNDKIVTHEDRNTLDDAFRWIDGVPVGQEAICGKRRVLELLTRLIAAAEADQPPLPNGWVLLNLRGDDECTPLWHQDDTLWTTPSARTVWSTNVAKYRDRLTPLRPTVTEADVEKAAMVLYEVDCIEDGWPEWASEAARTHCRKLTRAAFAVAGIEVSQP